MKNEKLLYAIGNINDELIENAVKNKPIIYKFRRAFAVACVIVIFLCVATFLLTQEKAELPEIEVTGEFGAMGCEVYMAKDISELVNANPWTEKTDIKALPVYKNVYTYDENYEIPKSNEAYMKKLLNEIKNKTENLEGVKIEGFSPDSVNIEFEPAMALPQKYNFDFYSSYEEMSTVAEYLKNEYGDFINMSKPTVNIYGGDYDIYGRRLLNLSFYESKGNIVERIINYNFNSVEFHSDDYKKLCRIRVMKTDLSKMVGNYPIITLKEAQKLLLNGNYITTVPYEISNNKKIEKAELIYRNFPTEKYFIPYYKFYIEVTNQLKNETKSYGAYYVPAVEKKYISNLPIWDGSFN